MDFPADLIRVLSSATRVVALTGAGASQESGLRTFRDAQTGLWAQYKPEDLASPEAFARDPKLIWDWYAWRREAIKGVRPNPGHYALVEMEKRIPDFTLITQNVDGLHRFAGSQNVLELHGSIHRCYCMRCGRPYPAERVNHGTGVPHCDCGGIIRPDIVFYEECLDDDVVSKAVHYIREAEVLIVGGTSLAVYPAAGLLNYYRGNKLVLINRSATPYDDQANLIIHEKIGEVFAQV